MDGGVVMGGVRLWGEGESKHKEPQGHLSPFYSLFLLLLFLPPSPLTMKLGAWMGCQGSTQWPVGPRTTLQSHVPVNTSLSQLTKHRVPLVLEDNRCVVHSGASRHSLTCCVSARLSICHHSSKSTAVCDLSFMTAASTGIDRNGPEQRGTLTKACKLDRLH